MPITKLTGAVIERLRRRFADIPDLKSQITDGAAAVLLASERCVANEGLIPLAWIVDYEFASIDPKRILITYQLPLLDKRFSDYEEGSAPAPLAKLAGILEGEGPAVFEAIVAAVAAGATVGEVSRTFRHDADPQLSVEPVAPWRAGEIFETLRAAVRDHDDAKATTIFCANLGNVARYMPRLDFVRGFFQTGGFNVQADRFYATPEDAAASSSISRALSSTSGWSGIVSCSSLTMARA